jgi:hypothetical protein
MICFADGSFAGFLNRGCRSWSLLTYALTRQAVVRLWRHVYALAQFVPRLFATAIRCTQQYKRPGFEI